VQLNFCFYRHIALKKSAPKTPRGIITFYIASLKGGKHSLITLLIGLFTLDMDEPKCLTVSSDISENGDKDEGSNVQKVGFEIGGYTVLPDVTKTKVEKVSF